MDWASPFDNLQITYSPRLEVISALDEYPYGSILQEHHLEGVDKGRYDYQTSRPQETLPKKTKRPAGMRLS
ncbi:hypothetical protein AAG747_28530 [Rapidithrix thailandica]|uniref:Uncharacterized protein n=1 Tax=Rapidithrix thailandica TaxID=413964 RepID=A0AAW9SKJ4_9BACT